MTKMERILALFSTIRRLLSIA